MLNALVIVCLIEASVAAQWPTRPNPRIPRTADGKPDLSAQAPRTPDGKPDLSGVWLIKNYGGGLFYTTGHLKLDEMLPWARALYKQREDSFRHDTDGIRCLPPGPKAGIGVGNFPMKIVQTPDLVVVLYEYQTNYRQFFIDGRSLPEDANPHVDGLFGGKLGFRHALCHDSRLLTIGRRSIWLGILTRKRCA